MCVFCNHTYNSCVLVKCLVGVTWDVAVCNGWGEVGAAKEHTGFVVRLHKHIRFIYEYQFRKCYIIHNNTNICLLVCRIMFITVLIDWLSLIWLGMFEKEIWKKTRDLATIEPLIFRSLQVKSLCIGRNQYWNIDY